MGFWPAKVLLSAVEMGLFSELAHRPEDLATLQGRLGLHQRAARDFLDTPGGTWIPAQVFEALYAHPARLREFLGAMSGISRDASQ